MRDPSREEIHLLRLQADQLQAAADRIIAEACSTLGRLYALELRARTAAAKAEHSETFRAE